jgi:hypothetical protein
MDDDGTEDFTLRAAHSELWNITVRNVGSTIIISSGVTLDPKCYDYQKANTANRDLTWLKTTLDDDGDAVFFSYIAADYDRQKFGASISRFLRQMDLALNHLKADD